MQLPRLFLLAFATVTASALGDLKEHGHGHGAPSNQIAKVPPGKFTFNELWDLNQKFWNSFIAPNNAAQARMINSTMFSEDIQGRIDLTRDFDGRELNTEYGVLPRFRVRSI